MNHHYKENHSSFFALPGTHIHETAIIGPNVSLGVGVKVGPYAVIDGTTQIGDNTQIHAHAIVGSTAQDSSVREHRGTLTIGSDTVIKEFVTISTSKEFDGTTRIGNHCLLMNFAHVCHDATLEDHVVLTNNVQLAGHVHVEKHATLMVNSMVHQWCRIGAYSALAPNSGTRKDIPPFGLFIDQPAAFVRLNLISLQRNGLATSSSALKKVFTLFYRDKLPFKEIEARAAAEKLSGDPCVDMLLHFIRTSQRGISRARKGETT